MRRLALFWFALCLAGCLRVATVGLGSDEPPSEAGVAPDGASDGQGTSTEGPQAALDADASTAASAQSDAGAADEDDEAEPDDEGDGPSDDEEGD